MPKHVRITIAGLCACFLKEFPPDFDEPIWNVIFPCDQRHGLLFSFPDPHNPNSEITRPLHEQGRDLFIDFVREDVSEQQCIHDNTFDRLLNLADADLHGVDGSGHCKLRIDRKSPHGNVDQVWMRVPNSILSVAEPDASKNCWLMEVDQHGNPFGNAICKTPKAESFFLDFDFEGTISIVVRDEEGNTTFEQELFGNDIKLTFNNQCPVHTGHNDFLNFYDVLSEGDFVPGRRFVAGKKNMRCPREGDVKELDQTMVEELRATLVTPEANCDPVIVLPSPSFP